MVQNGQLANETTFNTRLMSRTADTSTVGRVDLANANALSGASMLNIQRLMNSLASVLGMTTAEVYNFLFTYSSDVVGSANDTVLARLNALTVKFLGGVGLSHDHSGVDGQGEKVSALNLSNINLYTAAWQGATVTGATGGSTTVTTAMTGKVSGGGNTTVGVITTAPSNKVMIFDSVTGQSFEDAGGQKVYARITFSAGVWTLTYYTNEAGVETAYSFGSSVDVQFYFLEVFTVETRPTIPSTPEFGSLDITADVVDASATQRGVVNLSSQVFAGFKTFNDGLLAIEDLSLGASTDNTSGAATALVTNVNPVKILNNASLTSVGGLVAPGSNSRMQLLVNSTTVSVSILNEDAGSTAANRILTGTGADLTLANNASLLLVYNQTSSRWMVVGGTGGGGGGPATAPTIQKFLSGSGTYTTPGGVSYIKVKMVGGGGGGSGSGTSGAGDGGTGGNTTFGSSLLVCNGGTGGVFQNAGGTGGTASLGVGPIGYAMEGSYGGSYFYNQTSNEAFNSGGIGAGTPFGTGGMNGKESNTGEGAKANSGAGGQGGGSGTGTGSTSGSGGGAGGYLEAIISSPAASYAYAVGAAGSAGTAGTNGFAGGIGGTGFIIVEEYY